MIKTEFPHQSLMYIYYSKKLKNKSQLYKALMKMYNLCLLKIGDINITVSSLHPLRSIQQDLTQDVKQPDAIKYIHEVSNKFFFKNDTSDFIRQKLFLWQSYDQGFAPKFPENHNTSKNDLSIDRLHSPQQSLLENSSQSILY